MIHVVNAVNADVPTDPIGPDQVRSGRPAAGVLELAGPPGLEVGVWEHTVGTSVDVEVDEVFVVLSGRATITWDGGSVEVGAGDVVTLPDGLATTWTVHDTLRKVYVTGT